MGFNMFVPSKLLAIILILLNPDLSIFEKTVDPDQLASDLFYLKIIHVLCHCNLCIRQAVDT